MAREKQPVVLGTVPLAGVLGWLGFNHWALKVGEVWHEVGPGPDSNTGHIDAASDLRISNIVGEYMIITNTGDRATSKAEPTPINNDLWLTHLLPQAFLIGVMLGPAVWALGVPLRWAAVLGLILPWVTLLPRLENFCWQVKEQLGEEVTRVAVSVALILVVALQLGACWLAGMFGLLAVWWVCRVRGPELLNTWQGREPNRSSILGTTWRTEEEIIQFDKWFEKENPEYLGLSTNCQRYVRDLFTFLMEPPYGEKTWDLPPPQSFGSLFKGEQQKKKFDGVLEAPLSSLQPVFHDGSSSYTGCSLLHHLVLESNLSEIVRRKSHLTPALLDSGCQRRYYSNLTHTKVTALHLACVSGQREVVDILLERGADPNRLATRTLLGWTMWQFSPLCWAAGMGHPDICLALLAHGARLDVGDRSPMEAATTEEVRQILREG